MVLTKRILGAGGVPQPEIHAGSRGCCLVPHHVAPKATWSCENRVPPWFSGLNQPLSDPQGAKPCRGGPGCPGAKGFYPSFAGANANWMLWPLSPGAGGC